MLHFTDTPLNIAKEYNKVLYMSHFCLWVELRLGVALAYKFWRHDFEMIFDPKGPPRDQTSWLGFEAAELRRPSGSHVQFLYQKSKQVLQIKSEKSPFNRRNILNSGGQYKQSLYSMSSLQLLSVSNSVSDSKSPIIYNVLAHILVFIHSC